MTWRIAGEGLVLFAAVVVALGVLWRYGAGILRWIGSHLNAEMSERMEAIAIGANQPVLAALSDIEHRLVVVESEVTANGGRSLKDLIVKDRVEHRDRLDRLERELHEQRAIITAHVRDGHIPKEGG